MQTTTNLSLQIPDQDDIYDVDYVRHNMEILDELMDLDNIERAFNKIFFWYVPYSNIIEETFRFIYIHAPENTAQGTGFTEEDYGTEITAEEIRDIICAGWEGEDTSYYDNRAEAAEEQYHIVFGDSGDGKAMSVAEVLEAISTPWDGQSSVDPTAMSAEEVEEAISTPWDGQSSVDPTAMSATEILEAIERAEL